MNKKKRLSSKTIRNMVINGQKLLDIFQEGNN